MYLIFVLDQLSPVEDHGVTKMPQDAIVVRCAHKRYGKNSNPVLNNLNMVVPRGCMWVIQFLISN